MITVRCIPLTSTIHTTFQMDMSAYSAHNTGPSHIRTVASAERTVVNIPTAMNVSYTGKVASITVTFNWDRKTMLLLLPLHLVIHSLRRSVVKPIWSTLTRIRWHSPVASSVMMKTTTTMSWRREPPQDGRVFGSARWALQVRGSQYQRRALRSISTSMAQPQRLQREK